MTIQEWIEKQEADKSLTTEQMYARFKNAIIVLEDRLLCADADGVDLENVDVEDS